jgi:hypothetical protein
LILGRGVEVNATDRDVPLGTSPPDRDKQDYTAVLAAQMKNWKKPFYFRNLTDIQVGINRRSGS